MARRSKPRLSRPASAAGRERWTKRPTNPQGEKGRLKGKSTGGTAEQTYKHRARDALGLADLRQFGFRQASMSRGVEVRGSEYSVRAFSRGLECARTLASRAPSVGVGG